MSIWKKSMVLGQLFVALEINNLSFMTVLKKITLLFPLQIWQELKGAVQSMISCISSHF